MSSSQATNQNQFRPDSRIAFDSHSNFYTDIENVFTTPTTVSEASDDAKQLELEEELLSYCTEKERFLSIFYSLKDQKLEILFPFLNLLYLFKKEMIQITPLQLEKAVSDHTHIDAKESKTPSLSLEMDLPKYFDWDFTGSFDGLSMEPGVPERDEEQEMYLLEDVLNILIGYDGRYVKANVIKEMADKRTFRISSHIKPCLRGLLENILPAASDYSTVVRFIDGNTSFSAGKVNQALAASFSEEVVEYMNNVLGLEHLKETQNLNLHLAWCALQESMNRMRIMAKIANYINKENARGVSTLNILHRCTYNSMADVEAEKMCLKLTKAACAPYFRILEQWIYKGQINDPFDEFMVKEKHDKKVGIAWDQKFELRPKFVPSFLQHDDRLILNTGRYMYAVRMSMNNLQQVPCAEVEHIQYENIDLVYLNLIRRAYSFANENLLYLLEDDGMISWLRTAKSFFSLEYDDVFYNVMEHCFNELEKPVKTIFIPYLQELIDTSIRAASFGQLLFSTEYIVKLEKYSLMSQINSLNVHNTKEAQECQSGLEALTFTTTPPWPICIVFHSKTLTGYQMLFRHIFYLKYVYMKLTSTRCIDKPKALLVLKYSMTVFVQTCLSYMTVDTIQTLWHKFENEFKCADSVIELIQLHNNYMYQALMGCMLASSDVFQYLHKTLGVCLKMCFQMDMELESEFKNSLVALIKAASKEACWSSLIKALIPSFTNIPEIVKLDHLCLH